MNSWFEANTGVFYVTLNNSGPGIGELIFRETEEWVFASSTTGVEGRSLT